MGNPEKQIGLIAGSGPFPLLFAQKAREKGYTVAAVGFHNETDPLLSDHVAAMETLYMGQVGRLIDFFKKRGITAAVMVGAIEKPTSVMKIRPDIRALSMYARMRKNTHDDRVLRAFADVLEKEGIQICPSTFLLPELLSDKGCWTRRKPSRQEKSDIRLGWKMAKEIGRLDIGQCVVVGNGMVLAVEAIDGTDSTIRRGGALSAGNAVLVKVCKPVQDFRFDVPAVGAQTISTMHESGVRALAIEAGKSVVFDKQQMISLADRHKIAIAAFMDEEMEGEGEA
ncbi:MAG: UDP-2,3-diacylglucosamine diphosphatase LpxI [Desulfosalsimonadaceae bacterium]